MHKSAFAHMKNCIDRHMQKDKHYRIVEIGSRMVDDQVLSHRMLLTDYDHSYIGLDVAEGKNVDVVMKEPYRIPIESASADVIICGQVFEHVPFFWISFMEMVRLLRPGGLIFMTVPSRGHVHASKVEFDCWRFYPDSMRALAGFANLGLLYVHTDFPPKVSGSRAYDYGQANPGQYWGDTVAVFQANSKMSLRMRLTTNILVRWGNRQASALDELVIERNRALEKKGG